jgi:hypothetical protein
MTRGLQVVSIKLPLADLRRIPRNRSEFVRQAVAEKLARESAPGWQPKTATGRKLLKLRKRFLAQGGRFELAIASSRLQKYWLNLRTARAGSNPLLLGEEETESDILRRAHY